jgi:hypothetical protein
VGDGRGATMRALLLAAVFGLAGAFLGYMGGVLVA